MKVNIGLGAHNSADWPRFSSGDFSTPLETPDHEAIEEILALGDLAEPLGYDGIWTPEHSGTPYGMAPNPLQMLTYFAARTESISLGTMVAVLPWWHPVRLAHQIAYLDIISKGRFTSIGVGRGVAKSEFDAVGVARDDARQRYDEAIDILELALTQERFSYEGQIYKIPEMSIRPQPLSRDLPARLYGASSTPSSLELNARRGLKPLFVGNKPLTEAGQDVRQVNIFRAEEGLAPCQPKAVLFMYCTTAADAATKAQDYIDIANRDVSLHYGFGNPNNFVGVKGYEDYAGRKAYATAVTTDAPAPKSAPKGYDQSNLLIGTPEQIIARIIEGQKICSYNEITLVPNFTSLPYSEARKSIELFAREVLPVVQKLATPLHPAALPEPAEA
jgi:alkanesulfonate monooxygenase SsuD/methylene tetrahydromethanopterin reductase-like flavin-dependent oxidoreductase (luciferase family)